MHNDYPLAPEKIIVQDEWLSPYCKNIKEKFNLASDKTTKLIPTLTNKEKYVLHIKNLELYLKLGMKLTKIHRDLQFNESTWLADYIAFIQRRDQKPKIISKKIILSCLITPFWGNYGKCKKENQC